MNRIVVMGVTGSGKSTVGVPLAAALRVPFGEGDDFHSADAVAAMRAGTPLTDVDREPWLEAIGAWVAAQPTGAVVTCSALARRYRDRLRLAVPDFFFVHLDIDSTLSRERVAHRAGHFMPASLVDSQFELLEPLGDDERGIRLDPAPTDRLVAEAISALRDSA